MALKVSLLKIIRIFAVHWVVLINLELIRGLRYRKLCRSQPPAWLSPFNHRVKEHGTFLGREDIIMKTNQIMIRPMGDFKVIQRTKDAFFNATNLLKQWNQLKGMKKEVNDYFGLSSTKEFIYTIMERENYDMGNYPYHKSRANKGDNAGTWMHPLLFIDFAMWINPSFKYDVLKFVYDEMIKFRNLAGDAYPSMCKAVSSILPDDLFKQKVKDLAKSLNIIVYGKHESEMRNKVGDESKIRELYELELQIAQWIDLGFIKDYNSLKSTLTKLYYRKYPNVLPI